MAMSPYLQELRRKLGPTLLQLPSVAAVIRNPQGQILLQRRSDDQQWSLPAGAIDPGEHPAQALVREVWEETGLRVRPTRLLGIFSGEEGFRHTYPNGDQVEYMVALFACEQCAGHLHPRDGESIELRYFSPSEMPKLAIAYPQQLFLDPSAQGVFEWNEQWLDRLT